MRIQFDNGVPRGLGPFLTGHQVVEARAEGWEELANGDLITAAEGRGFDLLLTTDKNIRYQQNLTLRKIAVVVLGNSQWPMVRTATTRIAAVVDAAAPGSYVEVEIPPK